MEISLLFLDVDGVLNNSNKSKEFDEQCIKNLKNIVNHTNCKIIISSTYRLENSSFNRLWNTLSSFGIDFKTNTLSEYLITPDLDNMTRADEIYYLLKKIKTDNKYIVKSWIVLDDGDILDSTSMFIRQLFTSHFIKINHKLGLTEEDYELGVCLLNNIVEYK